MKKIYLSKQLKRIFLFFRNHWFAHSPKDDVKDHRLIPKTISDDEPLIRCIKTGKTKPNGSLKDDVLLPRMGQNDISLLRLEYTTLERCIAFAKQLDAEQHNYSGLLQFTQNTIKEVNEWSMNQPAEPSRTLRIQTHVEYTPMDGNEYADRELDYYTDSVISTPMHADLIYNEPFEKGEVRTRMREYIHEVYKHSTRSIKKSDGSIGGWELAAQ